MLAEYLFQRLVSRIHPGSDLSLKRPTPRSQDNSHSSPITTRPPPAYQVGPLQPIDHPDKTRPRNEGFFRKRQEGDSIAFPKNAQHTPLLLGEPKFREDHAKTGQDLAQDSVEQHGKGLLKSSHLATPIADINVIHILIMLMLLNMALGVKSMERWCERRVKLPCWSSRLARSAAQRPYSALASRLRSVRPTSALCRSAGALTKGRERHRIGHQCRTIAESRACGSQSIGFAGTRFRSWHLIEISIANPGGLAIIQRLTKKDLAPRVAEALARQVISKTHSAHKWPYTVLEAGRDLSPSLLPIPDESKGPAIAITIVKITAPQIGDSKRDKVSQPPKLRFTFFAANATGRHKATHIRTSKNKNSPMMTRIPIVSEQLYSHRNDRDHSPIQRMAYGVHPNITKLAEEGTCPFAAYLRMLSRRKPRSAI